MSTFEQAFERTKFTILEQRISVSSDDAVLYKFYLRCLAETLGNPHLDEVASAVVPSVDCHSIEMWKDTPGMFKTAKGKGAEEAGGFLVNMNPSFKTIVGWNGFESGHNGGSTLQFNQSLLKAIKKVHVNSLDAPFDNSFSMNLESVEHWPLHRITLERINMVLNRFDNMTAAGTTDGNTFRAPPYSINTDVNTPRARQALGFCKDSLFDNLKGNFLAKTQERYPGIHTPEAFVSSHEFGAPFGAHVEDFHLEAMNYLSKGAPKVWILIPAACREKFEELMKTILGPPKCSQFVRHKYCWPTRTALRNADIKYSIVYQQSHQAVVTMPGVYHWGFNLGANIAEAVNYMSRPLENSAYRACSSVCSPGARNFITGKGLGVRMASETRDSEGSGEEHGNEEEITSKRRRIDLAARPAPANPSDSSSLSSARSSVRLSSVRSSADPSAGHAPLTSTRNPLGRNPSSRNPSTRNPPSRNPSGRNPPAARTTDPITGSSTRKSGSAPGPSSGNSGLVTVTSSSVAKSPYADRITSHYTEKIGSSKVPFIINFVTGMGGPMALLNLKAALFECRARLEGANIVREGVANSDAMNASQRYQAADSLEYVDGYLRILWRVHVAKFADLISSSSAASWTMELGTGTRQSGNSATVEVNRGVQLITGAKGLDPNDKNVRASVTIRRRLGQRYLDLKAKYGWAVLALFPITGNEVVTDTELGRMDNNLFTAILEALERYKGEDIRRMTRLMGSAFESLFLNNERPNIRLAIEDKDDREVLEGTDPFSLLKAYKP